MAAQRISRGVHAPVEDKQIQQLRNENQQLRQSLACAHGQLRAASSAAIGWVGGHGKPPYGLLSLTGVGYPVASAILDILDSDVWPVIDKWAARTVFGTERFRYCAARYAVYARHLAIEGRRCWGVGLSIHQLDEKAQRASMKGDLPAGWRPAKLPPCV
jgi:hypothetical protein